MLRKGYLIIDSAKLKADCNKAFASLATKEKFISDFLESNGICDSTFSNCKSNYSKHLPVIEKFYDISNVIEGGYIKGDMYYKILGVFGLEDVYQVDMLELSPKCEVVEEKPEPTDVDVVSVLNKMCKTLDDIAYALLVISENTQKPKKPLAKFDTNSI